MTMMVMRMFCETTTNSYSYFCYYYYSERKYNSPMVFMVFLQVNMYIYISCMTYSPCARVPLTLRLCLSPFLPLRLFHYWAIVSNLTPSMSISFLLWLLLSLSFMTVIFAAKAQNVVFLCARVFIVWNKVNGFRMFSSNDFSVLVVDVFFFLFIVAAFTGIQYTVYVIHFINRELNIYTYRNVRSKHNKYHSVWCNKHMHASKFWCMYISQYHI